MWLIKILICQTKCLTPIFGYATLYKALFASNKYERKIITQTDPESGARDGSFWSESLTEENNQWRKKK